MSTTHKVRTAEITPELLRTWFEAGDSFDSANLRGEPQTNNFAGELTGDDLLAYTEDSRNHRITYVIVSCGTPVAWRGTRWWTYPATHSSTQARHQQLVRSAFGSGRRPQRGQKS